MRYGLSPYLIGAGMVAIWMNWIAMETAVAAFIAGAIAVVTGWWWVTGKSIGDET